MFAQIVLSCNNQAYLRALNFCKQHVLVLSKIKDHLQLAEKSLSSWRDGFDESKGRSKNKFRLIEKDTGSFLTHDQKMAKLEKLRKMELELAQLCKKCYAQKLECDKILKSEGDSRANGLYIYSSSKDGDLLKSGRSIQKQELQRKKNARKAHVIKRERKNNNNINYALEQEDRSANEILRQIRHESARLDTEVNAKILNPSGRAYEINDKRAQTKIKMLGDLQPGDLYNSTTEGEDRTVNEMPQFRKQAKVGTFSPKEHQNAIKMKRDKKISLKKRALKRGSKLDQKAEALKRNRLYRKPSTLTEYLYEFLRGRRSMNTYALTHQRNSSSGKLNTTSRQNKSQDKKPVGDNVYISPDLANRGLGAEAILKERRTKSKDDSK